MFRLARIAPLLLIAAEEEQCGPTAREMGAGGMVAALAAVAGAMLIILWLRWLHRVAAPFSFRPVLLAAALGALSLPLAVAAIGEREVMWLAGLVFGANAGACYGFFAGRILVRARPGWMDRVPLAVWIVIFGLSVPPLALNRNGSDGPLLLLLALDWTPWLIGVSVSILAIDAAFGIRRRLRTRPLPQPAV